MNENWRPIPGFSDYQVSDLGRVWSEIRNRVLRPGYNHSSSYPGCGGYPFVALSGQKHYVHLLVLRTFVGPCPDGHEALHGDGDRANARLDNLRWGTRSENMHDRVRDGNHHLAVRTHCNYGHEYTPENTARKKSNGSRVCRECARESVRRTRAKQR